MFAQWEEPSNILDVAWETDMQNTKFHRFIRNEEDRRNTMLVLREYYFELKNQFATLISTPYYPGITWLKAAEYCKAWKISD